MSRRRAKRPMIEELLREDMGGYDAGIAFLNGKDNQAWPRRLAGLDDRTSVLENGPPPVVGDAEKGAEDIRLLSDAELRTHLERLREEVANNRAAQERKEDRPRPDRDGDHSTDRKGSADNLAPRA